MKLRIIFLSIVAALIAIPTASADAVKIGFVTTLTTPAGAMGRDMVEAANIALDHIGHKMGGKNVEFIVEDDGFKPEIGKQKTDKLVNRMMSISSRASSGRMYCWPPASPRWTGANS